MYKYFISFDFRYLGLFLDLFIFHNILLGNRMGLGA